MRRPSVIDASPVPCLTRSIASLVFNIISSPCHPTNATHRAPKRSRTQTYRRRIANAPTTRRRRVAEMLPTRRRCFTDATLTHRQRLALHAQLLALTSTSFPTSPYNYRDASRADATHC
jgi:hypothetical protein